MRRTALSLILLALSGCVVTDVDGGPRRTATAPPPPRVVEVWYGGQHGVPAPLGGGWCYFDGPHVHDYFPEPLDWYAFDDGFFFWRGPVAFTYVGGHPMPGGGWCFIEVPHRHDYVPPYGGGFTWRGSGWIYGGPWSPSRPPPPTWWSYAPPRPPPPAASGRRRRAHTGHLPRAMRVPVAPPRPMPRPTSTHGTGVRTRQRAPGATTRQAAGGDALLPRAAAGGAIPPPGSRRPAAPPAHSRPATRAAPGQQPPAQPASAAAPASPRRRHTRVPRLPRSRDTPRPRASRPPARPPPPPAREAGPGCPARQEGLRSKDKKKETRRPRPAKEAGAVAEAGGPISESRGRLTAP